MNDTARRLVGLGLVLVLALGAAYGWAWVDNADRIADFGQAITQIGYARNGFPPEEPAFRAEVESLAAARDVAIESLTVTRTERTGVDAAGRLANERLASAGTVSMRLLDYDVVATVKAKKWLFTRTGNVNVRRSYRLEVNLAPSGPGGVAVPTLEPSVPLPELEAVERQGL